MTLEKPFWPWEQHQMQFNLRLLQGDVKQWYPLLRLRLKQSSDLLVAQHCRKFRQNVKRVIKRKKIALEKSPELSSMGMRETPQTNCDLQPHEYISQKIFLIRSLIFSFSWWVSHKTVYTEKLLILLNMHWTVGWSFRVINVREELSKCRFVNHNS